MGAGRPALPRPAVPLLLALLLLVGPAAGAVFSLEERSPPASATGVGAWQQVNVVAHPLEFRAPAPPAAGAAEAQLSVSAGAWLTGGDGWEGRLSGLTALGSNGPSVRLLALSDSGFWVQLTVDVGSGALSVHDVEQAPLLDTLGRPMHTLGYGTVFEGVSLHGDDLLVATEPTRTRETDYAGAGRHTSGVLRYSLAGVLSGGGGAAARAARPLGVCTEEGGPSAEDGVEALVHLGAERLLAICEAGGRGWIVNGSLSGDREEVVLRVPDGFRVTGATVAPGASSSADGWDVLVLLAKWQGEIEGYGQHLRVVERRRLARMGSSFSGGAAAGARRWEMLSTVPPVLVEMRSEDGYPLDNVEGVALVRTNNGRELVFAVSDDNGASCQRTVLLMLEPGAAGAARSGPRPGVGSGPIEYCGPQGDADFAAMVEEFWSPPPSLGRLVGAAVFTRHGDRTPLADLEASEGESGPAWLWGSSCSRYFAAGTPLKSLRHCATAWTPPPPSFRLDYRPGVGSQTFKDTLTELSEALRGPSVLVNAGQLTLLGSHQLRRVGALYGRRYAALRPGLSAMVARSTPFNRTVLSASAFIAGLREGAPGSVPEALALRVEPRLTVTFSPPDDAAVAQGYGVDTHEASSQLDSTATELAQLLGIPRDLFDKASDPLHDCLEVSACWGKSWAWPGLLQDASVREELLEYKKAAWRRSCEERPNGSAPTLCQVMTRAVLSEALADMEGGRLGYFSGHDSTLLPLFSALGLPSDHPFPPLAAHLALELYEDGHGQRSVAVVLNGRLQRPERCAAGTCTPDELRGGFVPRSPGSSSRAPGRGPAVRAPLCVLAFILSVALVH
ncbi:unnamed protein product [Prorocentrum cordatum]|uniref:Phytase-like domain-containing protein n=1 Tax=Prorocentrum cordatum TaxID=2364126 RepID=A0ABN9XE84_9DINO|nr:unnamed protein product [Polarella glacialis]